MALEHFARNFGTIWRLLRVSSIVSLLTPMSRHVFTMVVSRDIVLAVMASRIVRNSFPYRIDHSVPVEKHSPLVLYLGSIRGSGRGWRWLLQLERVCHNGWGPISVHTIKRIKVMVRQELKTNIEKISQKRQKCGQKFDIYLVVPIIK